MSRDLHSALKVDRIAEATGGGVQFLLVRLQYGKTDIAYALHGNPRVFTTGLVQTADYLNNLGFAVTDCSFFGGRCLVRAVPEGFDVAAFATAFEKGWAAYESASSHLSACGLVTRGDDRGHGTYGDGHTATKSNKLKESVDDIFSYVLTWIDNGGEKGWTFHYRPKHPPISPEVAAALSFVGGFQVFNECPQFDFEPCHWRFVEKIEEGRSSLWDERAGYVHSQFDAHANHFSPGLQLVLTAHAAMQPFGMSLLNISSQQAAQPATEVVRATERARPTARKRASGYTYDVALSFAGTERALAHDLATRLIAADTAVFYDEFYPEQLWGKDLPAFFDRIYRKDSRFCVIFVSREYAEREWTSYERRSAVARAVLERGREYILPIAIEPVELDGIPPTIGYVSIKQFSIEQIAQMLVKKVASA